MEIFWAEWDSLHFLSQGFILNIDILEQCLENCTETNLLWKFIENLYLYKILTSSSSLQCSAWASVDLKELTPFHLSLSVLIIYSYLPRLCLWNQLCPVLGTYLTKKKVTVTFRCSVLIIMKQNVGQEEKKALINDYVLLTKGWETAGRIPYT